MTEKSRKCLRRKWPLIQFMCSRVPLEVRIVIFYCKIIYIIYGKNHTPGILVKHGSVKDASVTLTPFVTNKSLIIPPTWTCSWKQKPQFRIPCHAFSCPRCRARGGDWDDAKRCQRVPRHFRRKSRDCNAEMLDRWNCIGGDRPQAEDHFQAGHWRRNPGTRPLGNSQSISSAVKDAVHRKRYVSFLTALVVN